MAIAAEIMNRGKTLTLRRTVPNDAGWLYAKAYSNDEFMMRFRDNDDRNSEAEVYQSLVRQSQVPGDRETYLEMAIVHPQYGAIGIAAAASYSAFHKQTEILLGLCDERHRHKLLGIEAMMLLVDLLFNRYKLHKLTVQVYEHNKPMQQIMDSLGNFREGIRREHLYSKRLDAFIDMHQYGILESDFRQSLITRRLSQRLLGRDITQQRDWQLPVDVARARSGQFTLNF